MDPEGIHLNELDKKRKTNTIEFHSYLDFEKQKQMNKQPKKKSKMRHVIMENKWIVLRGEGRGPWEKIVRGSRRHQLPVLG